MFSSLKRHVHPTNKKEVETQRKKKESFIAHTLTTKHTTNNVFQFHLLSYPKQSNHMTSKKSKGKPPPLPIFTLRGHKAPINAIVFLKDDSLLLSGDSEGSLIVWNAESRRIETTSRDAHEKGVLSLEVMSDGRILSQGRGGDVKIWRYTKILECLHVMSTGSCTFCKMHFRDTRVLTPSSDPNMFQCWTLESSEIKKQIYVPKCSFQSGMCLALRLLDKSSVLVGFESGHVAYVFEIEQPFISNIQQQQQQAFRDSEQTRELTNSSSTQCGSKIIIKTDLTYGNGFKRIWRLRRCIF